MGKKKSFIDKRSAVTYSLIYRSTEDADAEPERVLVEADKGVGIGKPDLEVAAHAASGRRYPPGHPLAWLEDEVAGRQGELSEERRRELLELGFPDDGYDYLRHMRTVGRGGASLESLAAPAPESSTAGGGAGAAEPREEPGLAGPSVFVPAVEIAAPEEDVRLFDASRLTVLQPVEQEEAAAGLMGGVTAFSRQKRAAHGAVQREIAELDELMRQMEEDGVEAEGEEGAEGVGDLLDDFIITATEVDQAQEHSQVEGSEGSSASDLESYDPDGSDLESDSVSGSEGGEERGAAERAGGSSRGPGRPGSIASTYWRDERQDRKELLAVIDERFEQLALEYDEDEIGEMDDQEEEIRGRATLNDFQGVINEFAASHSQSQGAYEDNVPYHAPGYRSVISQQLENAGLSDDDADVAVQKAHEALRRAEETPDERRIEQKAAVWVDDAAALRERWDCESVLSLRSNLDNHPGKIQDPGRLRKGGAGLAGSGTAAKVVAQGMIKLGRHGIPMGVLPGKPTAAALRRLDERAAAEAPAGAEAAREAQRTSSSSEEGSEEGAGVEQGAAAAGQRRDKGETAEEKKARKAAVKEAKREARVAKKDLKQMFKQESAKAQRRAATAQVQPALRIA